MEIDTSSSDENQWSIGWEDPEWWDVYPGAKVTPGVRVKTRMTKLNFDASDIGSTFEFKRVNDIKDLTITDNVIYYYLELSPRAKKLEILKNLVFMLLKETLQLKTIW